MAVDGNEVHLESPPHEIVPDLEDCRMLDAGRNDVAPFRVGGDGPEDRGVVALGRARGEEDLTRPSAAKQSVGADDQTIPLDDAGAAAAAVAACESDTAKTSTTASSPQVEPWDLRGRTAEIDKEKLAEELGVGKLLVADIIAALSRPGRDPRKDLPSPVFRHGIMKLEDLKPGMELMGTVLNVVDFGVFVDVGLSETGLVHISRLADRFIKDP